MTVTAPRDTWQDVASAVLPAGTVAGAWARSAARELQAAAIAEAREFVAAAPTRLDRLEESLLAGMARLEELELHLVAMAYHHREEARRLHELAVRHHRRADARRAGDATRHTRLAHVHSTQGYGAEAAANALDYAAQLVHRARQ